ncbi:MAG: hypothetical protein AAF409_12480 [Pseudomonadota bacterium]
MSWLSHILVADMLRTGGVLLVSDPADMPLSAALPGVRIRTPDPLWQAIRLGDGTTVARDLAVPAAARSCGPVVAVLTTDDQATAMWEQPSAPRPDVLHTVSGETPPGYASLAPECPDIAVAETAPHLAQRARFVATAFDRGDLTIAEVLNPKEVGSLLVGPSADGGIVLNLDPMGCVRGLDRSAAFSMALTGRVSLERATPCRIRVPTLGLATADFTITFSGPPPHRVPVIDTASPQSMTRCDAELAARGPVVHVSCLSDGAPWVDVSVVGNRLDLDAITIRLPSVGPHRDEGAHDPLGQYEDPLAVFSGTGVP